MSKAVRDLMDAAIRLERYLPSYDGPNGMYAIFRTAINAYEAEQEPPVELAAQAAELARVNLCYEKVLETNGALNRELREERETARKLQALLNQHQLEDAEIHAMVVAAHRLQVSLKLKLAAERETVRQLRAELVMEKRNLERVCVERAQTTPESKS